MNPYNPAETKLFKRLNSPKKIQDFLALKIRHNPARDGVECRSPRRVLREGKAHCMEGALLAAAILEFHGHKPLLLDLRSTSDDLDHVVALFSQFGCWGAISKTNHVVLRYREPIYKSIRELALSYFHEYFLDSGKKTLREYSMPFDLGYLDKYLLNSNPEPVIKFRFRASHPVSLRETPLLNRRGGSADWRITDRDLDMLPEYLDSAKHYKILSPAQIKNLRKADAIEIKAGKLVEWKK
jgi:hypothetical protein